jgi:hypothetical protein
MDFLAKAKDMPGNLAPLPMDLPVRPRPWSKPLEEVLKKEFPSHNFEEAMELLFHEYQKNYYIPQTKTQPALPATPQMLSQRQTPSISPGVSTSLGQATPILSNNLTSFQVVSRSYPVGGIGSEPTFEIHTRPVNKRKRRSYTPTELEQVNQTRKRGACEECHRNHKKVPTYVFVALNCSAK